MVVEHHVVPLVPRLQEDLALLGHLAHVHALRPAAWGGAQPAQLLDERPVVDKGIVVRLQDVAHVVVGDGVLQHKVGFEQDALVVGLLLEQDDVVVRLHLLLHLGSHLILAQDEPAQVPLSWTLASVCARLPRMAMKVQCPSCKASSGSSCLAYSIH